MNQLAKLAAEDLDHILEHAGDALRTLAGARLFITGGTGFVGKWLVESLLWANDHLNLGVSAVALTRDPDRFLSESPHLARHPAVRLLHGNVSNFEFPSGNFAYLIHAATEPQFDPTPQHPLGAFARDIEGTRRVLDFAKTTGVRRLLFTSSGAVYGKQPPDLTHVPEEYAGGPSTVDTCRAYGQAKRVSEFMCAMYARQYGFSALIARLFAFVGPHVPLDVNFAVGNFIRDALAGHVIRINGDGTPYRSYLYSADLAIWVWTILAEGESARPYNVGSADALTILDLARTVAQVTAPQRPIEIAAQPQLGIPASRYVPCTRRAEDELGLHARIELPDAIRRTLNWHQYKRSD
jgi:nucleoside-diphosphate-sugar epimerase